MAEIGEPVRRRILVPDELPAAPEPPPSRKLPPLREQPAEPEKVPS